MRGGCVGLICVVDFAGGVSRRGLVRTEVGNCLILPYDRLRKVVVSRGLVDDRLDLIILRVGGFGSRSRHRRFVSNLNRFLERLFVDRVQFEMLLMSKVVFGNR